ncbi:DUF3237 domain-containing protein [Scopulibacillus cellulosilyticus]|uniref:UPF0311 protein ACFQRG_19405 n=1 Tax=Scopulibacillus cellulosilyticus TaxID=2665665 RepID=A0ABW2Q0I6_9BACL
MPAPLLEEAATLNIQVAEPIVVGESEKGRRQFIPIISGTVNGPKIKGKVLPGGADSQIIRPNGLVELSARYVIETTDGEKIYIENNGIRHVPEEFVDQVKAGKIIDPKHVYFRTIPTFETASSPYKWLTNRLFIGSAVRLPNEIILKIYLIN